MARYKNHYDEAVQRALEPKRMGLVAIVESNKGCGVHSVMIDKKRGEYVLCLSPGKTERDVPLYIRRALKKAAGKTRVVYSYRGNIGANHIPPFGARAH
jgi:hypothetical protein